VVVTRSSCYLARDRPCEGSPSSQRETHNLNSRRHLGQTCKCRSISLVSSGFSSPSKNSGNRTPKSGWAHGIDSALGFFRSIDLPKNANKNKHKPVGLLRTDLLALTFDEWPGLRRIATRNQPLIRLIGFLLLPEHRHAVPSGMLQYYCELDAESAVIVWRFRPRYTCRWPKAQ
jgi:acyl-CoA synthetase (AMP-forming)/AMP-acid ligase II